ncbi:M16 family metallopeptidase [Sphingomonas turrisvirgatae]|uniref:Peptidase M16 n=1 Tax=Sphingomonas turrisvirgatae TaxID=1888892 RepID=A0A1E3LWA8_9SPHN|nr:pitrilysin family protein [Sphingomonas turrisvirgatae]ODP38077.1 peptidase M16 [Sphingomonas turrisvirgatae]
MKSHLASLTAVAVVLAAPANAQQAPAPVPVAELVKRVDIPYEEFRLANGLRVVVHTDRKAPIVGVAVWYDVGSKHEPKGKTGFAHLFEHLMFNGSENSPGEFFEPLKEVGATDYNGTTSADRTNYFQTVPRAALERALFLESDRMGYLLGAVTQAKLDEQRGVVQNEKRQGDNQPYGLLRYRMMEGLFPEGHPYHHSTIGSMADLDAASLEDVKNWFRQYYGPNNAVLVLAGDIDAATARPLVEKYFGAIKAGPKTAEPKVVVPTLAAPKVEVMKDRVAVTRIYRMWAVPGMRDADSTVLDASMGVLGGLSSSRLDNALVRKEKLAVSVGAFNQSYSQVGVVALSADVRPGVDPALVGKRLDEIVADYMKNGPTKDELERYKTRTAASRIRGLESVGGFGGKAVTLASGALYMNDPGAYKKDLARLAAVTPEQARAVTAKWLSRPVYSLTIEPGQRAAYAEAAATAAAKPVAKAPETAVKGTRGPLPPVAEVKDIDFPTVTRTKLSNGIELIYAQRDAVPVTQAVISFDAGVASDVPTALGTENMTLSLMEEGTKTRNSIAIAEAQERLGAGIGAGSSPDRAYVSMQTPSPNLAGSLELMADITRNPAFPPAELERVRNQTLAQIAQVKSNPNGLAQMAMPPLLYGKDSPYAKLAAIGGGEAAVRRLTRDDLMNYYKAWIRPEKAKIFVVSDRPLAEIKAAFDARFGDWKGEGPAGTKTFAARPQQATPRIVLIDRPDSPQSIIYAAQMTPVDPFGAPLPLATASEVLGGDFLSRINMNLREDKSWSYGVRNSLSRLEHAVPYTISAPVQADKTGPAILELQKEVRDYLSTRGVTKAEFDRSVTSAIRKMSGQYETAGAVLGAMQSNDFMRRPDEWQDELAKKYRALTPAQVDAAARAAIDPNRFVWVVVGDAGKVRPQLDSLGLPVEVVPAAPAAAAPKTAAK